MVLLCLSVPDCIVGLRDTENLTAFDIARGIKNSTVPTLFYLSILELDKARPHEALLRMLTVTSEPATDRPVFPGEAIFDPINDRNSPLIRALIARGVDLAARKNGDTALHVAAAQVQNSEVVAWLLEAGSDIDAIGAGGATPLHYAARTGDENTVRLLLRWGAGVLVKDMDNKTALDWATENEDLRMSELLLEHVAHVGARATEGRSTLEIAEVNQE